MSVVVCLGVAESCTTDDNCNLNGVCTNGKCVCVPEWVGPTCGQLNLSPARPRPHSGYDEVGSSSWGGSIVADPTDPNLYHMYASRMAGHCGLNSWKTQSEIIHATSTDPEGPYAYNSTILPHFAHGPKVRRLADGSFLMMHLGCGYPILGSGTCKNGTMTPTKDTTTTDEVAKPPWCTQFNVSIKTAKGPYGPWTDSKSVHLSSGARPANESWYAYHQFCNPSPHVMPDGSLALAYRSRKRSGGEFVSVGLAATSAGPYTDARAQPAISTHTGEDPFLWQDERGHWHMLMHNMGGAVGSHAFSRDAKNWTRSADQPYTSLVTFSDGTSHQMQRRERPELLLSTKGQPRYFTTGVEDYSDHVYTLTMKVNADYERERSFETLV